jgi:D-sedoheptulose 7-phosphate isomerase
MKTIDDYRLWLLKYFDLYKSSIFNENVIEDLIKIKSIWETAHSKGNKVIFVGNGGSAAMASHCSVDLTKNAGVRAINFNEADLITCFSNDYGYEKWVVQAIEFYGDCGDVAVLISSSGNSMNMINAAIAAKKKDIKVITFTGFDSSNKLSQHGDINVYIASKAYNIVEMTHHIWLLAVVDMIIGNSEYSA